MTITAAHILSVERDSTEIRLQLEIPADLIWFDGHFPDCPILPGVVQTHWAMEYGREYYGVRGEFQALSNVKFMQVIVPNTRVLLTLKFDALTQVLSFRYTYRGDPCSQGSARFAPLP